METREKRPSRKEDVAMMARVCDALPMVGFFWPMVSSKEYGHTAPLHNCHASLINTLKHVRGGTTVHPHLAPYIVEMASVVAGSTEERTKRPPICANICTISPLSHDKHGIETALIYAEAGIPISFMAMPTMGSTAPATLRARQYFTPFLRPSWTRAQEDISAKFQPPPTSWQSS